MLFIKTQRDALLTPLQSVSGIVEKRHTLPILSNVLLEKKADILTLVATDIEIQITTSTGGAVGDGDGAVTVGARKLQDILRSLPDSSEVSLNLEDKRLQVRAEENFDYTKAVSPIVGTDTVFNGLTGCSLLSERFAASGRW